MSYNVCTLLTMLLHAILDSRDMYTETALKGLPLGLTLNNIGLHMYSI